MKKIGLFLLAAVAALGLNSCNTDSGDYASAQNLATVHTFGGISSDYYFELDNGQTLYPSDRSRIGSYEAEEGARVIIYYTLLEEKKEGFDHTIKLYGIDNSLRWGQTATVASQEELNLLGNAATGVYQYNNSEGNYAYYVTPKVLTLLIGYNASDYKKHTFSLVKPKFAEYAPEVTEDGYLNLELCHNDGGDKSTREVAEWMSFQLGNFPDLAGMKGVIISMKKYGTEEDEIHTIKIDIAGL